MNGTNGHTNGAKGLNGVKGVDGANGVNGVNGVSGNHTTSSPLRLFALSANTEASLKTYAQKLSTWAAKSKLSEEKLSDISYTLLTRRSLLPWRHTIIASDLSDLSEKLGTARAVRATPTSRLAFIFTGQGAQWVGMGKELINFPAFSHSISKSESLLLRMGCDWHLKEEIFTGEQTSRLNEAEVAQPATTALQIALVDLLSSLKIRPKCVVGHSSGEIAAAYAAGALTHESAMEA